MPRRACATARRCCSCIPPANIASPGRTSLLTVRGSRLRKHTGQVSFPGGAVDPGESFEAAALARGERRESASIPRRVRVLGRLTPLHIPVSGFLLHPVVGIVDDAARLSRSPSGKSRDCSKCRSPRSTIRLVKREQRTREHNGQTYPVRTGPYFDIDGEKVWGATAMALAEFLAMLDEIPRSLIPNP